MKSQLQSILEDTKASLERVNTSSDIESVRVKYLGKKSPLTEILRTMGQLSADERKELGKYANSIRDEIENLILHKTTQIKQAEKEVKLREEVIDVTEPSVQVPLGSKHPITITIDDISKIFKSMGYSIAEGPEIETVFNNFDALNSPANHPARDMTDTFYISDNILLRTQTSPVQIRNIQQKSPPIKMISPGRCFRCDTPDATHSPMFHQIEGLLVDEGVTMADLKGTLDTFAKRFFGSDVRTKFRPHHFPFTEPSAEMDMTCFKCNGAGCRVCKGSGWIEILGCGMVHPNVLKVGNIDVEKYTGFAFGMGVERIAMLKYEIDDIRLMYENDMRFVGQFKGASQY